MNKTSKMGRRSLGMIKAWGPWQKPSRSLFAGLWLGAMGALPAGPLCAAAAPPQAVPIKPGTGQTHADVLPPPLHPGWLLPLAPASLLLPGSAHYAKGDREAAARLATAYGVSLGAVLSSSLALALSGAANATVFPFVPLLLVGATSWMGLAVSDLLGAALPSQTAAIPYQYPYAAKWWLSYRYRYVDDFVFATKHYSEIAIAGNFAPYHAEADYGMDASGRISMQGLSLGRQVLAWDPSHNPHDGLHLAVNITNEDNRKGYYSQTAVSYLVESYLSLGLLSPSLRNVEAVHRVGYQQLFTRYDSPHFRDTDSNSSLTGGFTLYWVMHPHWRSFLGYSHERDTTTSNLTDGFTGVYFGGAETALGAGYHLNTRLYLAKSTSYDLALSKRF